jgi:hypothetical protein
MAKMINVPQNADYPVHGRPFYPFPLLRRHQSRLAYVVQGLSLSQRRRHSFKNHTIRPWRAVGFDGSREFAVRRSRNIMPSHEAAQNIRPRWKRMVCPFFIFCPANCLSGEHPFFIRPPFRRACLAFASFATLPAMPLSRNERARAETKMQTKPGDARPAFRGKEQILHLNFMSELIQNPETAEAYNARGEAKRVKGELDGALADFT